jgi:hypothetical protein
LSGKPTNYVWLATIFGYRPPAPKPKYPTHSESTHFAGMTYYGKALFSGGFKLTAVHCGDIK